MLKHWKTLAKVRALMALGDLSVLGSVIGRKTNFDKFDSRKQRQCLAYGRDRGETGTAAQHYPSLAAFNKAFDNNFAYLFENGTWKWRSRSTKGWNVLTPSMVR